MIDMHLFRDQLARIPSFTEPQARRMLAQLRRARREAEAAAMKTTAAEAEPTSVTVGIGVVGLLAR